MGRARGLHGAVRRRQRHGLPRLALAAGRDARAPRRVGAGRAQVRRLDHLVPDRRRHLHRLHLRGRAGAAVRRGRDGLLRPALHRDPLSAGVPAGAAAVVGLAGARLRHAGRLRAWPLRQLGARSPRRGHRARRDDALHRAAARRARGRAAHDGAERHRALRAPAAVHRVRDPRGLHLPVGPARPGADRVRQGHPDLRRDPRGRGVAAGAARRLVGDLRRRVGQARAAEPGHRAAAGLDPAHREQPAAVHHPRPGLGARAVPLPALAHGHPRLPRAAT